METVAELIQRAKKAKTVKCRKSEVVPMYQDARRGSTSLVELCKGHYLPKRVTVRLKYFPRDASVEFAPSTYLTKLDAVDMLITWPTKRKVSRYRLHMIPACAVSPR